MAFNSIVIGAKTFNSVGNGSYSNSTAAFGGPGDILRLTPGKKSGKTGPTTSVVSRHFEKDFTVGDVTERRKAMLSLQFIIPDGFTTTEVNALISDIGTFASPANLTRLFLGES